MKRMSVLGQIARRILMIAVLFAGLSAEATGRVVRVGCLTDMPGFSAVPANSATGQPTGLCIEYVDMVAAYAGWRVEYVPATWEEQREMVRLGDLDLIPGLVKTPARAMRFHFAPHQMGKDRLILYARKGFNPERDDDFEGKRIAVIDGNYESELVENWSRREDFRLEQVRYDGHAEVLAALRRGDVDLACTSECDVKEVDADIAPLFFLDSPDMYLACHIENVTLIAELDEAVEKINNSNPDFTSQLRNRFISETATCVVVPEEERQWLKENGALRIGLLDENLPYASHDEAGRPRGALVNLLDEARRRLMLPKTAVQITLYATMKDLTTAVQNGEIDAFYPSLYGDFSSQARRYKQTFPVYHSTMIALCRNGIRSQKDIKTFVSMEGYMSHEYVNFYYPDFNHLKVTRRDDVAQFLQDGRADAMMLRRERVPYFPGFNPHGDHTLVELPYPVDISFAMAQDRPIPFALLNRLIMAVSEGRKAVLLARHQALPAPPTARLFWNYNKTQIVSFGAIVLFLVLFLLYRIVVDRRVARSRALFFSTVSHDIRTPLNAIIGYADLLDAGLSDETSRREATRSIRTSGKVLLQLVNDVLDLSRLESSKLTILPEPTDVARLTREMVVALKPICDRKGLALVSQIADIPPLMLDAQRIRQILYNLIGNAAKFTDRGSISVTAGYRNGQLRLSVTDTGAGIHPRDLRHLFRPFAQTAHGQRRGGTGLGLAICDTLARRMGGRLRVSSTPGKGSTFALIVPASRDVEVVQDRKDAPSAAAASGTGKPVHRKVLFVDDSSVNRLVGKALLAQVGVTDVILAENGKDALSKMTPDVTLILTDLWMPEMDGESLLHALRSDPATAKVPVYAVTADVQAVQNLAHSDFNGILLKPITLATIKQFFSTLR